MIEFLPMACLSLQLSSSLKTKLPLTTLTNSRNCWDKVDSIEIIIGSYGAVYQAIHKESKEIRAIKLIDKANVPKEKEAELFSEIKVLKEMDHPKIMKIYGFSSDNKYYYLISE